MTTPLLNKESRYFLPLISVLLICVLSGFVSLLVDSFAWWIQFNMLGHILSGIVLSLLCLPYIYLHFKRTLGMRRSMVILSGVLSALLIVNLLVIGLYMAIVGHIETQSVLRELHLYGSYALLITLILHLVLHRYSKTRKQKNEFHTLAQYPLSRSLVVLSFYLVFLFAAAGIYEVLRVQPETERLVEDYEYPYGDHPFRPSQTETTGQMFIASQQVADSGDCAGCHREIADQWASSSHRHAASDPAYVTNINLLESQRGISATRYCEGCHAPIALLSGQLTPGGSHGGIAGTDANIEGVSCLGCHRITSVVHDDGVASYHYTPANEYLFQYATSTVLKKLNRYLVKVYSKRHKADMMQPVLARSRICATCHAQFMDKDMNDWGWVKMQDEYSAWQNSPYSQKHQQGFSSQDLQRCQDCHMPLVSASDPSANREGKVRSHRFTAANTMLPLLNGDRKQLELTTAFLQSNKMHITIEPPNRETAIQSILPLDNSLRTHREKPTYYYLGEKLVLNIITSNTGVGHDFPGGTIDINQAWIQLNVRDAEGISVFDSGALDANDVLDSNAHWYGAIPVNRQGHAVWRHDLFNMIGESYHNVIKAGASDIATYEIEIPHWAKGPLIVNATLKYRKLNTRYARWALGDRYQPLPITTMARDNLLVELRHEPRVITP